MENIFKNAYFGKAYKTRKGEKLIFQQIFEYLDCAQLFSETRYLTYDLDGLVSTFRHTAPEDEIIGEWHEEISEEELDKLAIEERMKYKEQLPFHYEFPLSESVLNIRCKGYLDGFKDGYRKTNQE